MQKEVLTPYPYGSGQSPSTPPIELPSGTCTLCTDRITSQLLEARTSASLDIAALERKLADAQRTITNLKNTLETERSEHGEVYRQMRSKLERAEDEVRTTRTQMHEMISQHYNDHLKAGIKNGDIIVTEPKTLETQKSESESPCQTKKN